MGTILTFGRFRFEIRIRDEHGPAHVHVVYRNEAHCKICLFTFRVIKNEGFSNKELNILRKKTIEEVGDFLKEWRRIHGDK